MEAKRPSVKLIVINGEREVLIATSRRSGSKRFPGGGIEPGEKVKDAARRELFEETNLVAISMIYLGVIEGTFSSKNTTMAHGLRPGDASKEHYFLINRYSGEPETGDDVSALEWIPEDQVENMLTYETQKEGWRLL